jgi:hypothetical protein
MSEQAQLTPWFDSETAPVRDGWYDVRTSDGKELRAEYLTTKGKGGWWATADGADARALKLKSVLEWRGLTAPAQ